MSQRSGQSAATRSKSVSSRRNGSGTGRYSPEETRRELVASAMRLFERQGFLETSVQAIADDAGLTKGAFYHHFGAKEDVLVEIQREYLDAQAAAVEELTASTQDPVAVLEGLVRLSVRSVDEYRAHVAIFLQDRRHLTGKRFTAVKKRRDVVESAFVEALSAGMESGAFRRADDPRVVAYGIIGMCAWVYQWFGGSGRLNLDQVADVYWSMIYDGLRTDR